MSFADVLAAARELSAEERQQLAREIVLPDDGIPEHLRQFIPPPGTVLPYWKPELTSEGWEQVQKTLSQAKGTA